MEHAELATIIADAATLQGLPVTREQSRLLAKHLACVLEANQTVNLTRIIEPKDAVRRHIIDSLLGLSELQSTRGPLVDLGSGPGYPGLALAIVSGRETTLVESNGKKATFLSETATMLGLDERVTVYRGRAEDLALSARGNFGVATSRALSSLPSVIELSAPLLSTGGSCIAYKGRLTDQEIAAGDTASSMCGMKRESVRQIDLAGGDDVRVIVTYRRIGDPRIELPRRTGLAQRRPLA